MRWRFPFICHGEMGSEQGTEFKPIISHHLNELFPLSAGEHHPTSQEKQKTLPMDLDKAKYSSLGNFSLWLPSDHRLPALRLIGQPRQPIRPTYLSTSWLAGNEPCQGPLHHGTGLWLSAPGSWPAGAVWLVPNAQACSCPPLTNKWLSRHCQHMDHGLPVSRTAIFLCLIGAEETEAFLDCSLM